MAMILFGYLDGGDPARVRLGKVKLRGKCVLRMSGEVRRCGGVAVVIRRERG